jgi:hypothetical protein
MATGSGKTLVMAMVVAWHVLNRVTNPQDKRFSRNVFVVAPGLTVKKRLKVIEPSAEGNYYDVFDIVPSSLRERLRQGRVLVRNWHALNWESDEQVARKRGVDKRGAKSDAAYMREVLGDLASASGLLVINDEAHHAWRVPTESKVKGVAKADIEEATKWVGGLDRIHRSRGILACYDFSATPFAPSGKKSSDEALFDWIVIRFESTLGLRPVFDTEKPIRSTGDMLPWFTSRPWEYAGKSHVNRCVFDSTWEASEAYVLDHDPRVVAWAKNDHLGFEIVYVFEGVVRKYRPDFLARLTDGTMLVLEVKGQDSAQNQTKRKFLDEWVTALNGQGGFGKWGWAVAKTAGEVASVIPGRG